MLQWNIATPRITMDRLKKTAAGVYICCAHSEQIQLLKHEVRKAHAVCLACAESIYEMRRTVQRMNMRRVHAGCLISAASPYILDWNSTSE
jgi:hypothetical protein